ncbi:hypothetical protein BTM444_06640 [Helicobacter pylori]
MVSNTILQKNLDAFYTHPKIARFCLDLLKDLINQNLGLDLSAFHFLEPSAGSGSFVDALKGLGIANCLALDIAPKAQGIQKKDYLLEWIEFNKKRVIIGNPPFGHRGKLALDFLNKSLNEAPIVAFILPNLFKRYSVQKHIDKRAKLVLNADLEKNAFIFNERPYDVKCVFQIYMHKNIALNLKDERILAPPKIRHNDFITYIHNNTPHTLKNPFSNLTSHFLYQPFGSQNYPDFLVFIFDYVVGIEIKFSKNDKGEKNLQISRPMWNSNLPKPNAIYVYGVANANITFFKGSDILSYETREVLLKYFDILDKDEESLKNALKDLENPFGFAPYIRKAYEHKKEFSNHHQIESFFSPNHILRERNVLEFLKTLTH